MYGGHTSKCEDVTTGVCCNIVLQFTNKQQSTNKNKNCHVRNYVNDTSWVLHVSRRRLQSYVTDNAYEIILKTPLFF